MIARIALAMLLAGASHAPALAQDAMPKPATLTATGMPDIPAAINEAARGYFEGRSASFGGWDPTDGSMLISDDFAGAIWRIAHKPAASE